jgi:hypothetical protein
MRSEFTGPRYNKIKGLKFEIQVRTLCMHAWAAISHYLDYKAEWDIPIHLRKGLNALSGLFYVADEQYEQLYNARQESRISAGEASPGPTSINLDTVAAFLSSKYPERKLGRIEQISTLVREMLEGGYSSIGEVDRDLRATEAFLGKDEAGVRKTQKIRQPLFYNSVGAVRTSLAHKNVRFKEAMARSPGPSQEDIDETEALEAEWSDDTSDAA